MDLYLLRPRKNKAKDKDLFSSSWLHAEALKSIDFLKKQYLLKIGERSARFKRLAEMHNTTSA